jgi:cardiolipin synthase
VLTNWQAGVAALLTLAGFLAAGHALLNKRDPRAALGWCAICLMVPLLGAILYVLFGINRVRSRARRLQLQERNIPSGPEEVGEPRASDLAGHLAELARLSGSLQQWPLTGGNLVKPLRNGEEAFPAMLSALNEAQTRISLSSYIFDTDDTGRAFVDALAAAAERGVDVRVLVDGVGELYAWPHASRLLRKRGVPVRRFAPPTLIPPSIHFNLRNHRKILVVDGKVGFAGGMNIGDRHLADRPGGRPALDMHFRFDGPVVAQLEQAFFEDWERAGGQIPEIAPEEPADAGPARCRVLTDGPGEDMDKLTILLSGAVSLARQRVLIMTPYFLPPRELMGALVSAALRGVEVSVILPEKNNLPYVHWATSNMLWELLRWGVRVFYQPGHFNHSKLFIVDDSYVQVGSANLDPRSLRLNFELAVEIFDAAFSAALVEHCMETRERSREVVLEDVDGRPLPVKLRDSIVWLFSPYL